MKETITLPLCRSPEDHRALRTWRRKKGGDVPPISDKSATLDVETVYQGLAHHRELAVMHPMLAEDDKVRETGRSVPVSTSVLKKAHRLLDERPHLAPHLIQMLQVHHDFRDGVRGD